MGLLEELKLRMDPTNYYRAAGYGADLEPATDYTEEGVPVRSLKRKQAFPDPYAPRAPGATPLENVAMPPAPISQMTAQAGLMAPNMGPFGGAPGPLTPQPAAAPPEAVPLPMPRPASAPGATDVSAAAREPVTPLQIAPAEAAPSALAPPQLGMMDGGFPGILGKIASGLGNNSNALLAIGAGFAGAPNIGQGISRASAALIPAHAADLKQRTDIASQNATYQALVKAGAPESVARAAVGNPILMKSAVENYLADRKGEMKNIKLPNGTEISVLHNPFASDPTKRITDLAGNPFDPTKTVGQLIDPNLTGDEAAAAAQAADPALYKRAIALVEGRETWPTGRAMNDPKAKAATDLARQIDPNLTEQTALQRSVYMKDAANTKSGLGFQVKGFHQGIEHLAGMAKDIEKFNPSSGMGSADLAHLVNAVKQRFGENSSLARAIQARAQAVSGEVGKLYSGNSAGGVHEREKTANLFATKSSSADELAGSLQGTIDLMEGGLSSLEQNRDRTMGEKGSKHPSLQFRNAISDARIEDIKRVIARLKGEEAPAAVAAAPAAGAAAPRPGRYIWDQTTGKMVPAQ